VVDASHHREGDVTRLVPALAAALLVALLGTVVRPRPAPRRVADRQRRYQPRAVRCGVAAALLASVLVLGVLPTAAITTACWVVTRWRSLRAVARAGRIAARQYPDAIDLIVLAIRAGHLPAAALATVAPSLPSAMSGPFRAVAQRVADGERFADALAALEQGLGPMVRPLVDSFAAADRYGLPLAPVLERLADEARQQRRRVADTAARQLPVRLSIPLALCTLPSFVLLAIVPLLLGAFSSLRAQ
jgi:pilus assembly protein TadC